MSGTEGATATIATTGTATDPATATTTTATAGTGTEPTQGAVAAQTQAQPTVEQLQADLEKWKTLSRKNEQTAKANKETTDAQQKLLAEVAAKLGIQTADGRPDPAAITAQLEAAQRESRTRATELAVLRAASRLGADGDALLDSRAFVAQLEGLDSPEAIEAAIKLAVAQAPGKYGRAGQGANTAAGDTTTGTTGTTGTAGASTASSFNGSPGGNRQWTDSDVANASPAEVKQAMEDGLLDTLLGKRR